MEAFTVFICVLLITILLLLTVITYVIYSGLFHSVQVGAGKPAIRNVQVAYKFGRGPYKDTGYVFTEATSIAPKHRCIGVYYDDPNQVAAHKLRWAVGSILSEGDEIPNVELVESFKKNGFSIFHLPQVSNVVRTTFPERTSLSVLIGIFKVYPLLGEYVRINKLCAHPWMEVYDGKTIYYMAPLAKQDEFYVPESLDIEYVNEDEEADTNIMETVTEEQSMERSDVANGDLEKEPRVEAEAEENEKAKQCPTTQEVQASVVKLSTGAGDGSVTEGQTDASVCAEQVKLNENECAHDPKGSELSSTLVDTAVATLCGKCGSDAQPTVNSDEGKIQDGGVSSSMLEAEPPSSASSVDSSRLSAGTESSSVSFYSSQSEQSESRSDSASKRS